MKVTARSKNKQESWREYMAYVEQWVAAAGMDDVQSLRRQYGVGIEGLVLAVATDANGSIADEIVAAMRAEGFEYE